MINGQPICKVGDRIRLLQMGLDPCPIEPGATGTIRSMTPYTRRSLSGELQVRCQVCVDWDVDRSLGLVWPIDHFEVISDAQPTGDTK